MRLTLSIVRVEDLSMYCIYTILYIIMGIVVEYKTKHKTGLLTKRSTNHLQKQIFLEILF